MVTGSVYSVVWPFWSEFKKQNKAQLQQWKHIFWAHFKDRIKKKIIILILKFKSQQSRRVAALTFRDAPDCRPDVFPPFTFTLPPTAAEWLINAHTGRQTRTRQTRVVPPTHPVLIVRMDISLCCRVNTPPLAVCPSAALICVCVCHMALSLPL